ncbi:MAG TPA: hypothetical protein EYQ63_30715 [Fuerstia sp.]|nr:hypothetical protein [Fuerstiella sp.]
MWGYVGEPSLSKATRKDQYLFLNGRSIQDRSLQHALSEAYRGLLMVGRHPVSFLFLEVPPNLVDVNVHPTKTEVRFQDGQSLYRQLLHTLRDKFLSLDFQLEIRVPAAQRNATEGQLSQPSQTQKELDIWSSSAATSLSPPLVTTADDGIVTTSAGPRPLGEFPTFEKTGTPPGSDYESFRPNLKSSAFRPAVADALSPLADVGASNEGIPSTNPGMHPAEHKSDYAEDTADVIASGDVSSSALKTTDESTAELRTVHGEDFRAFQIHDCYLVVAGDDGLEVIDQHALHERILYEHLRHRVLEGKVESQKLLMPESIECSAGEAAVLLEYQELLLEIGFGIEDFGGTTVLLTSHPVMLPRGSFIRILRDLAAQLEESDGKTSRRDLLDHMMHTMACRAAIKAGQRLAAEEMQELLGQRHLVDDAHHCPHGRPTSLMLSRGTLDKQFGRLG